MPRDAGEHNAQCTRAGLENLLNPLDENDVGELASIEKLGRGVAVIPDDPTDDSPAAPSQDKDMMLSPVLKRTALPYYCEFLTGKG